MNNFKKHTIMYKCRWILLLCPEMKSVLDASYSHAAKRSLRVNLLDGEIAPGETDGDRANAELGLQLGRTAAVDVVTLYDEVHLCPSGL